MEDDVDDRLADDDDEAEGDDSGIPHVDELKVRGPD